jgi:hypothetical protein
MTVAPPARLYKYRDFSVNTLRMLTEDEVFYASPSVFNDPLDSSPTIEVDIDISALQRLLEKMLVSRSPIERVRLTIDEHRYMATELGNPEKNKAARDYYIRRLADNVLRALRDEYAKFGVLSLAGRWNCPLMWSHYADHHKGVCVEYATANAEFERLHPVNYGRPRTIKASTLVEWKFQKSPEALRAIEETLFLSKASQWRYEKEWRAIVDRAGTAPAPARLTAIHFGLRCDTSVIRTTVLMHRNKERGPKFYAMHVRGNGFQLSRARIDVDEIHATGIQSAAVLDFRDIFKDERDDLPIDRGTE